MLNAYLPGFFRNLAPLPSSPGTHIIGYCFWPLIQFIFRTYYMVTWAARDCAYVWGSRQHYGIRSCQCRARRPEFRALSKFEPCLLSQEWAYSGLSGLMGILAFGLGSRGSYPPYDSSWSLPQDLPLQLMIAGALVGASGAQISCAPPFPTRCKEGRNS